MAIALALIWVFFAIRSDQFLSARNLSLLAIDLSVPKADLYRPPVVEKCWDHSLPIGPWIVDRNDVAAVGGERFAKFVDLDAAARRLLRRGTWHAPP